MKYSLSFFDYKNLRLYNNFNSNPHLFFSTYTIMGSFAYNVNLNNFVFLKFKYNSFFFKTRFLHSIFEYLKVSNLIFKRGFSLELLIVGLGFKLLRSKKLHKLFLDLHFSHNLIYTIPNDIAVKCSKKKLLIFGLNKQRVSDTAFEIKSLRVPNIYKGKGIRFTSEVIKLKPGKQR